MSCSLFGKKWKFGKNDFELYIENWFCKGRGGSMHLFDNENGIP